MSRFEPLGVKRLPADSFEALVSPFPGYEKISKSSSFVQRAVVQPRDLRQARPSVYGRMV